MFWNFEVLISCQAFSFKLKALREHHPFTIMTFWASIRFHALPPFSPGDLTMRNSYLLNLYFRSGITLAPSKISFPQYMLSKLWYHSDVLQSGTPKNQEGQAGRNNVKKRNVHFVNPANKMQTNALNTSRKRHLKVLSVLDHIP